VFGARLQHRVLHDITRDLAGVDKMGEGEGEDPTHAQVPWHRRGRTPGGMIWGEKRWTSRARAQPRIGAGKV